MPRFHFVGQHTGGRDSITMYGVTFVGRYSSVVEDEAAVARLRQNVEFSEAGEAKQPAAPKVAKRAYKRRAK